MMLIAGVSFGVARLEFRYAAWTRLDHVLPAFTEVYARCYHCVWGLPVLGGVWGWALLRKAGADLHQLLIFVSFAVVLSVAWALITALSLYLCNQTFVM